MSATSLAMLLELQADVGRIAAAQPLPRPLVHGRHDPADVGLAQLSVSQIVVGFVQGRLDLRVVGLGQVGDVGDPLVERPDPDQVVDDGFLAGDRGQSGQDGVSPARRSRRSRLGGSGTLRFAGCRLGSGSM